MPTLVDPPQGWQYGFPAPVEADYEAQLRAAGYPENQIPYALKHSRYSLLKEPTMNRLEILAEASALTGESRNKGYGEPKDNLSATALLFDAYLQGKYNAEFKLSAEDVAWLNVLQKISRQFYGMHKLDTFIDAAAYAAIAGEVSQ